MARRRHSRFARVSENLSEINGEALLADGFEGALIGIVERFGMDPIALYDKEACLDILIKRDRMTPEDAAEYFDFNVIGAWMGNGTPAFAIIDKRSK